MPPRKKTSSRQTWATLIIVVALVAAVLWTANAIVNHNSVQNCIDSGRHNCLPMPDGTGG